MKANFGRRAALAVLFVPGLVFLALGPFSNLTVAHNELLKTEPTAHAVSA